MYDKVVSFGCSCAPAAHIRDMFDQPEAYFFDWLIAYYDSLLQTLEQDFGGLVQEDNLSLDARKIRVLDSRNGLLYQHDFPAQEHEILPGYRESAADVRAKYTFLANRTRTLLSGGGRVLIVHYALTMPYALDQTERARLSGLLRSQYPRTDFSILWVTMRDVTPQLLPDSEYLYPVPPTAHWKGEAGPWREAFHFAGALPPVPLSPT